MFIIQSKIIFKSMHVQRSAWLTSLHHSTYASMHAHIHMYMFMANKQIKTLTSIKEVNKQK